uniref:Secreted protein n=1 Tax=Setaria digitata TaxID=48799 RepID=A0A915PNC4_9BILA
MPTFILRIFSPVETLLMMLIFLRFRSQSKQNGHLDRTSTFPAMGRNESVLTEKGVKGRRDAEEKNTAGGFGNSSTSRGSCLHRKVTFLSPTRILYKSVITMNAWAALPAPQKHRQPNQWTLERVSKSANKATEAFMDD